MYSVVKKSIVPMIRLWLRIGKQTPERTPARIAAGPWTQSVNSPMSRTKTRSLARQARPDMPTPSAKVAARVTLRNSSPAEPESVLNLSTLASSAISQ